jgi:hypothetical protein
VQYRCGAQFTSKLEGMLTDMNVSKDNQASFFSTLFFHLKLADNEQNFFLGSNFRTVCHTLANTVNSLLRTTSLPG